jgi:hypothetical protein
VLQRQPLLRQVLPRPLRLPLLLPGGAPAAAAVRPLASSCLVGPLLVRPILVRLMLLLQLLRLLLPT